MNDKKPLTEFDLIVDSYTVIENIFKGSILVNVGATLLIGGIVNGNVTISKGASLEVSGILNGNIENEGNCSITGVFKGRVINNEGTISIDPNAIVKEQL